MARMIDADEVDYENISCSQSQLHWLHRIIEMQPTVDAVEVVRCRDCAKDGLFTCPICFIENKTLHFINHSPDFYCGEGERKDGDGNG